MSDTVEKYENNKYIFKIRFVIESKNKEKNLDLKSVMMLLLHIISQKQIQD